MNKKVFAGTLVFAFFISVIVLLVFSEMHHKRDKHSTMRNEVVNGLPQLAMPHVIWIDNLYGFDCTNATRCDCEKKLNHIICENTYSSSNLYVKLFSDFVIKTNSFSLVSSCIGFVPFRCDSSDQAIFSFQVANTNMPCVQSVCILAKPLSHKSQQSCFESLFSKFEICDYVFILNHCKEHYE